MKPIRNFITLTHRKSGQAVAVAIDKITTIGAQSYGTDIWTAEGQFVNVQETVDQVLALIDKASHDDPPAPLPN